MSGEQQAAVWLAPYVEQQPLTGEARHQAVTVARAAERAAEAKEQEFQNEHHPVRDDERGTTSCSRCGRLLGMDRRPKFRQLHPCVVLHG